VRTLTLTCLTLALIAACSAGARSLAPPSAAPQPITTGRSFIIGAATDSDKAFTAATGVRAQVIEHYTRVGRPFSVNFAGPAIPFLQIEPRGVPLTSIISGREDTWLRAYAQAVARYGKRVILGFAPEMNGSWYTWGYKHVEPPVYIAAWRHVITVFRTEKALNVTWVWTVNVERITSDRPSRGVSAISPWWPGRGYVTWVGIDGYYLSPSQHFRTLFGPTISEAERLTSQPILISETAASPWAGKAAKIPDLFTGARSDRLAGVIWFDLTGNQNWKLDTRSSINAFRQAAHAAS
jgi:Glycosyl hydrolase family 26